MDQDLYNFSALPLHLDDPCAGLFRVIDALRLPSHELRAHPHVT